MAIEEYPSVLGQPVELIDERRAHILKRHPAVAPFLERIGDVPVLPEEVRKSTPMIPKSFSSLGSTPTFLAGSTSRRLVGGQPYEGKHPILI